MSPSTPSQMDPKSQAITQSHLQRDVKFSGPTNGVVMGHSCSFAISNASVHTVRPTKVWDSIIVAGLLSTSWNQFEMYVICIHYTYVCLSTSMSVCQSFCLSVCLSVPLSHCLFVSVCVSVCMQQTIFDFSLLYYVQICFRYLFLETKSDTKIGCKGSTILYYISCRIF